MGKVLCKYYSKRADKFLSNLEEAEATYHIKDIHKVRTELKKIRCIYSLLKQLIPPEFKANDFNDVIADLFECSGKLREIQINITLLKKYSVNPSGVRLYSSHLKKDEDMLKLKFKEIAGKFDSKKFKENNQKVIELCKKISKVKIAENSEKYISDKIDNIKNLEGKQKNTTTYHNIRIYLKRICVIAEILSKIKKDTNYKNFIKKIARTEVALGKWHDRVILTNSINRFLKGKSNNSYTELRSVLQRIYKDNKKREVVFDKEIKSTLFTFK